MPFTIFSLKLCSSTMRVFCSAYNWSDKFNKRCFFRLKLKQMHSTRSHSGVETDLNHVAIAKGCRFVRKLGVFKPHKEKYFMCMDSLWVWSKNKLLDWMEEDKDSKWLKQSNLDCSFMLFQAFWIRNGIFGFFLPFILFPFFPLNVSVLFTLIKLDNLCIFMYRCTKIVVCFKSNENPFFKLSFYR